MNAHGQAHHSLHYTSFLIPSSPNLKTESDPQIMGAASAVCGTEELFLHAVAIDVKIVVTGELNT